MSETLSSGLTLTIPTLGDQNWDELIRNQCFLKISEHDHTGGGKGLQLATAAIQDDAITGAKIRLANNSALKARNAANSANISLIRLDGSDFVTVGPETVDGSDSSRTYLTGAGSIGSSGSRGAYIILSGNEDATYAGRMQITCGNTGSAYLNLLTYGAQAIKLGTNNVNRWDIDSSGHIVPIANNSYDLGSASFAIKDFHVAGNIRSASTILFTNQTTSGSAGVLNQYWTVTINGTQFKVPCYNL